MPTAARLVAAILLAILGWVLFDLIRPLMPEGTDFGWFNYVNAFIGWCVGWIVMGRRAGRGFVSGINNASLALLLWCFGGWLCILPMKCSALRCATAMTARWRL